MLSRNILTFITHITKDGALNIDASDEITGAMLVQRMIQIFQLYVFILAGFVGFIVIQRVPPLLHTPLMSATNAISGISLVGAIVAAGGQYGRISTILGFVAVVCATTNVTAGFLITDRMLAMFKGQLKPKDAGREDGVRASERARHARPDHPGVLPRGVGAVHPRPALAHAAAAGAPRHAAGGDGHAVRGQSARC